MYWITYSYVYYLVSHNKALYLKEYLLAIRSEGVRVRPTIRPEYLNVSAWSLEGSLVQPAATTVSSTYSFFDSEGNWRLE
jgi:hypothetical protein